MAKPSGAPGEGSRPKIHLKTDLDGYPIGFHLTGGEASDSRNFEVLLDLGPDVDPCAVVADKAMMQRQIGRRRVTAAFVRSSPVARNYHRQAEALRKGPLQSASAYRANDGQDQALQTHRAPLREDFRNKLCLIPRTRLRIHLDQTGSATALGQMTLGCATFYV